MAEAQARSLRPMSPEDLQASIYEIFQRTAANPNLEHDRGSLVSEEAALHDLLRRYANPYGFGQSGESSRKQHRRAATRTDLESLLHRSAMLRNSKAGEMKLVTFNKDSILTAEEVFAEAASKFHSDLLEEDQRKFIALETPESLVEALTAHVNAINTPHRSRLHDAISKVASFASALSPYFRIVEIIITSHPEFAAIALGGIYLVFQLSSQYVEYFERLAEMFEQMSEKLPRYSRQFDLISDRGRTRQGDGEHWRWQDPKWNAYYISLAKSLGYVYKDILVFCQDACAILPRHDLGKRERMKRFMTRAWTPFDQRFGKTMHRIKIHQQLFEEGLQEAISTEIILAFNDLDRDRQANKYAHEETQRKLDLLLDDSQEEYTETQKSFLEEYLPRKAAEDAARSAAEQERSQKLAMTEKVGSLRTWIAASDWTTLFYTAERHRTENTGDWFLRHQSYKSWIEGQMQREKTDVGFSERLLLISGKPGYGKTVLSTRIISDIRRRVARSDSADKGSIAFFHFNAQHSDATSSGSALRAILTQLLQENKDDTDFIDLGAIMMEDLGSGQSKATEREVQSIIRVFLGRLGGSFLIFDALDECEDWEEFLRALEYITTGSNCSIICLARPHLSIATTVGSKISQVRLETYANLGDMKLYLEPKIQGLHRHGKLPSSLTVTEMVDIIVSRADSMFLWVVLMVGYLSSPLLTPNDRLEAINNIRLLEGLDAIFKQILEDLQRRLPKSEWSKIKRMFQWLVVAQRPWNIEMLRTALAVQSDRAITADDYISEFEESLVHTCGSFIEVYPDGTVRFIHLSVQEFLADPSPEYHESELSRSFHVQKELAHCSMSTLCLQYIIYNIPHKPVGDLPQRSAEASELTAMYPLLPYATKWWSTHACHAMRLSNQGTSKYSIEAYRTLFTAVDRALWDKELLSFWIETSYIFRCAPSLDTLSSCISAFKRRYPDVWKPLVSSIVEKLGRLAQDLSRLNSDWGHILRLEPNEIWLPSINAVGRFHLWASSHAAKMTFLGSNEDKNSILIASQVGADGKSVGMLKIWTSVSHDMDDEASAGYEFWEVAYQIWSLETMSQTECIRFEIPQEQLLKLRLNPNTHEDEVQNDAKAMSTRFRFPVAFSSSLSLLIVHGILLKIAPPSVALDAIDDRGHFQILPPPGCEHTLDLEALAMARPMHAGRNRFSRGFKIVPTDHQCHSWAQYLISPNEKYLIQINGSGPPSEADNRRWIVSVYKDKETIVDSWIPSFYLVASVGIQFRRSNVKDNTVERFMSFHPFLPVVAVCRLTILSLWHFMEKGKELIEIYSSPLDNICWSICGNYLQGTDPVSKRVVFLDLTSHMPPITKSLESSESSISAKTSKLTSPSSGNKDLAVSGQQAVLKSENTPSTAIQTTHSPVFSASPSGLSFSSLVQNRASSSSIQGTSSSSSIILQTISSNGCATNSNLMRLPASSTLEKSYSTLVDTGDNENLRLVLNMAAQETYSVGEKADFSLPAVFDRKTDSVPRVEVEEAFGMGKLRIYGEYEEEPARKVGKLIEPPTIDAVEDLIYSKYEEPRVKAEGEGLTYDGPMEVEYLEDRSIAGEYLEELVGKQPRRAWDPKDETDPSKIGDPGNKVSKLVSEATTKTLDSAGETTPSESQVGRSGKRWRIKAFLGNVRSGFSSAGKRRSLVTKTASETVDVEK